MTSKFLKMTFTKLPIPELIFAVDFLFSLSSLTTAFLSCFFGLFLCFFFGQDESGHMEEVGVGNTCA